ncbi:hypothetical protein MROS_0897 [Melioribacter roseus P3M-2]|uniref:DUF3078 domain-containing protein n=1 Tax=Melioribacter roseus (strain DSM 23840 / JCM 17771 / VKM B-2668 / P3M-2) TaxID=1191523 RepID=I6ZYP1_MELRP|nr:DUF3078 domain-containing protein [Melioribacter roseus]AFN74138.1 hypothetical protein MROS_0897 [Melioribacter roseus P3M-2]
MAYRTVIIYLFSLGLILAQTPDSLKGKWIPGLTTGLGINQVAFNNWVKGGENSIAWTLYGDFKLKYGADKWNFKHQLKAVYGRAKIGEATYKTTENDLFMEDVLSYKAGWAVDPFFSNSLRTQVTKGYDYKLTGAPNVSDFFDPGYITQTFGFAYDKYSNITTRIGVAFQEVISNRFIQYTDDPETSEIETFKFETGFESVTDMNFKLDDNIALASKLRLFSRFESLDVWDVRWDNVITAKVNNWLSVNFTYLLLYEKAQSLKTQTKEALQIGITYSIL